MPRVSSNRQGKRTCDRENTSTEANIDKTAIVGSGSFKNVFGGLYAEGPRRDEFCIAKEMKTGPVELEKLFWDELHACTTAANLIEKFNKLMVVDKPVKLNRPEVWQYSANNKLILIEPYIENFRKFNSNTGWVAKEENPWIQILQALSHFSYHASGGACVLCDLQGAIYDEFVVLTDPVIVSRSGEFGATDLGPSGIKQFFHKHKCNDFCNKAWCTPNGQQQFYPEREGTSACTSDGKVIDPAVMGSMQQLPAIPEGRAINRGMPGKSDRGIYGGPRRRPPFNRRPPLGVSSGGVRSKSPSPSPSIKSENMSQITQKMAKVWSSARSRDSSVSRESSAQEKKTLTVLRQNLTEQSSNKRTWRAVKKPT